MDSNLFWVIFDTCTRPEYYQDIHNLLALPPKSILRYEYRSKYLSDIALTNASNPKQIFQNVLLLYAQTHSHKRGDLPPEPGGDRSGFLWVATRVASLNQVASRDGGYYYFDLVLLGYPRNDPPLLENIIDPLIASDEVPFTKWVTMSKSVESFAEISQSSNHAAWVNIVNALSTPPSQFHNDAFWRIINVQTRNAVDLAPTTMQATSQSHVTYRVFEETLAKIVVESYKPPSHTGRSPAHEIEIKTTTEDLVSIMGTPTRPIRQYTEQAIDLRFTRIDGLQTLQANLSILSGITNDNWPNGANLYITFLIRKNYIKLIAGILIGIFAFVSAFVASQVWTDNRVFAFGAIISAAIALIIAVYLLTGRIQPPKV